MGNKQCVWAACLPTNETPGATLQCCGPCDVAEVEQWRGRCWRRDRRSHRSGWGSAWLRGTAAGCWRRCSKTRDPRTPWTQTVPAALTPTGPALPPQAEMCRDTCMDTWALSWTTASVSPMICSCTQGPPRTGCSPPRGSTYSVKTGLWEESSTKSALVRRCLKTCRTLTVWVYLTELHRITSTVWCVHNTCSRQRRPQVYLQEGVTCRCTTGIKAHNRGQGHRAIKV